MAYCTDADMVAKRPNILSLGVTEWDTVRTDAETYINKRLLVGWYRPAAVAKGLDPGTAPFDPTKVDTEQMKIPAVYKSLEFAYMNLMKDSPEADGFERNMNMFAGEFEKAFDLEMALGLKYDWDDDGETSDEYYVTSPRRLSRS